MEKNARITFITTSGLKSTTAQTNRKLAIASGIVRKQVQCDWILLSPEIDEAIVRSYASVIRFIGLRGNNARFALTKCGRAAFFLLGLIRVIKCCSSSKCVKTDSFMLFGESFMMLKSLQIILSMYKVRVYHERGEHPYYNDNVGFFKKINIHLYMRYVVPRFTALFVISTALEEYFAKWISNYSNNPRVFLLPMLVDLDSLGDSTMSNGEIQVSIANDTKDIVFVGSLYGDKDGVYDLIKAFSFICDEFPHSRLILIGDNRDRTRMEKIHLAMKKVPSPDRVVFTGLLSRVEVGEWLRRSYCLALSRPDNKQARYGFPTKLGEYLASGKPVVVTSVGDIPLYLKDNHDSFICHPDDPREFAHKLHMCLSDELRASSVGDNGYKLAQTIFSPQIGVKVLINELQHDEL
jgi:glycosyltransferase involved in cell wall biosynthesis